MPSQKLNIREKIQQGREQLRKAEIHSPLSEAELLMCHLLGLDRAQLWLSDGNKLEETVSRDFDSLISRREKKEPFAYITGQKEFYGRKFFVNSSVLIPRPDTEVLVQSVLEIVAAKNPTQKISLLDLGTGSGCIAVTLGAEAKKLDILAIDKSRAAIEVAEKNAKMILGQNHRLNIRCGDFTEASFWAEQPSVDIIVSNPPYVSKDDELSSEVKDFEPGQALFADENGLKNYSLISKFAKNILKSPDGILVFECGRGQSEAIKNIIASYGFSKIRVKKDYNGIDRVIIAYL